MPTLLRLLVCSLFLLAPLDSKAKEPPPNPKKILFIGNSYTAQIREVLSNTMDASKYQGVQIEYITKGGATLAQHLDTPNTLERIASGDWHVVVLQEQSQTPALPGRHEESFKQSVKELSHHIKQAGAEPMLYMTWGRRDGDAKNKTLFPNYETMQKKLSKAYRDAAKKNKTLLAPVGDAWARLRKANPELGKALYKKDGSHPSEIGAYLVTCTFLKAWFNDPLIQLKKPAQLGPVDQQKIIRFVSR